MGSFHLIIIFSCESRDYGENAYNVHSVNYINNHSFGHLNTSMDSHRLQNKLGSGCPNEAPKSLSRDYSEQGSQGVWLVPLDAGLASVEKQLVPLR